MSVGSCAPCGNLWQCFAGIENRFEEMTRLKRQGTIKHMLTSTYMQAQSKYPRRKNTIDLTEMLLHRDSSRNFENHYEIIRGAKELGKGAFGEVFKVKNKSTDEIRAMKTICKSRLQHDLEAVSTELEAMMRLSHPNIINFFEFFEEKSAIYVIVELIDGGDFHKLVVPKAKIDEIQTLFRDVFLGVAYCHSMRVAHRDLKMDNCLICEGETRRIAKVIDFGLSAIQRREPVGDIEEDRWLNETLGTKFFVAPEVIASNELYGMKCDSWSLGVMLYIILTNDHPFAAAAFRLSTRAVFRAIIAAPLRLQPLKAMKVPEAAQGLIQGLLHRDVDLRLSAQEALDQQFLRTSGGGKQNDRPVLTRSLSKRIQSWNKVTTAQKVLLMLEAHQAHVRRMDQMRLAFQDLDANGNGYLSFSELREGLVKSGYADETTDFEATFEALDADANGVVNYLEWITATMEPSLIDSRSSMREVFDWLDEDGDGAVSREELQRTLAGVDGAVSELMEEDTNHDGILDWDEFQSMMHKLAELRCADEASPEPP